MPIPALLAAAAATKAIGTTVAGIGKYRAAKGIFTEQDAAELARLERLKAQGDLGLSEREKAGLVTERSAQAAQTQAELQQQALQQQAAGAAMGAPITGRDVFLREQAAQLAKGKVEAEVGRTIAAQGEARRQEQLAKMAELRRLRSQEEAARKSAIFEAVGLGVGAIGDVGVQAGLALEEPEKQETPEVIKGLKRRQNPYSGRI